MAPEPDFQASADYSCSIHLYNKSNVDFSLLESKAQLGSWVKGSPPNVIEAGEEVIVQISDAFSTEGSQGKVTYELYHPKKPDKALTFTVEFCDPFGMWNDNYLHARSSNPQLVSCNVLNYSKTGHPFTGHVEIYLADAVASVDEEDEHLLGEGLSPLTVRPNTSNDANEKIHAAFEIGFPSRLANKKPVHEDMTIAAFIISKDSKVRFPKGTTYNNLSPKQWEYIRGLVWSDDPSCLLFENSAESNSMFGAGIEFWLAFKTGPTNCMTQRSHFGNLQFLHAMANEPGENPRTTKARMLAWMEVMYNLAIGGQGVNEHDKLDQKLPANFSDSSDPSGQMSLRDLILGSTTDYRRSDIPKRALGNCLHIIQDSYAIGHTLRHLRNPGDLDSRDEDNFIRFKPGTYAQLGPIITFHTYPGQSDRHKHYDESTQDRNPKDLNSFNHIIGARDAIEKSKTLIDFYAAKTTWKDGVEEFLINDVFALDAHPTDSNPDVDEKFGALDANGKHSLGRLEGKADEDYRTGRERKLALLESGLAYDQLLVPVDSCMERIRRRLQQHLVVLSTTPKYLIVFIGLLMVFVLAQLASKIFRMS